MTLNIIYYTTMITIDGSLGEGGGQIFRTALTISSALGIPVKITNIRKNRPKPGLSVQHLGALNLLQRITHAKVKGGDLGSQVVEFQPQGLYEGKIVHKIETAASITLLMQTLLPLALFIKKPLEILFDGGATLTFFSPPIFHTQHVLLEILQKYGLKTEIRVERHGFYPAGGAKVWIKILPSELSPIDITETGAPKKLILYSVTSSKLQKKSPAQHQIEGFISLFPSQIVPIEKKIEYPDTLSLGSALCAVLKTEKTVLGSDIVVSNKISFSEAGKRVAQELLREIREGSCVDKHTADMLPVYMALQGEKGQKIKIGSPSSHLLTVIKVIEPFDLGHFKLQEKILYWYPS